ncbi:MAG: hypothetical protein KAK04_19450 [Cyclobacteriaceae bacterium]|nr:hypothetical protein [Cyclobacteriaceae bacterium]
MLNPSFEISPLSPSYSGYDPATPNGPYANAYLYTYGGITMHYGNWPLQSQYNNDEIIIGYNPVSLSDTNNITNFSDQIHRKCSIVLNTYLYNVLADSQLLIVFGFRNIQSNSHLQFFVGTDLVRTEIIDGTEQIAILLDHPGGINPYIYIYARLASNNYYSAVGFSGATGYII